MKNHHAWILYTLLGAVGVWAADRVPSTVPSGKVDHSQQSVAWEAASRSENQTRWRSISRQTNATTGKVTASVRSFVELGAGLNVRNQRGEFQPADTSFAITATGAEATRAAHQIIVPGDIGSGEGVTVVTPQGQVLGFQPVAVNYFDPVDGSSVLLDSITSAVGWLVASNEIIYSNCFPKLKASVRVRNLRSGVESDLILHEQPPEPFVFGLSDRTRLEMLTEQVAGASPQARTNVVRRERDGVQRRAMLEPDLTDHELAFAGMTMMPGKAFGLPREDGLGEEPAFTRVGKSYLTIANRRILIEAVEYQRVQPMLRRLPSGTSRPNLRAERIQMSPDQRLMAARPLPARLAEPAALRRASASKPIQQAKRAESGPKLAALDAPVFVLDYQLINSSYLTDYTFQNDTTYHVADSVSMEGTTTLEGGAVLKYSDGATLFFLDPAQVLECKTDPYRPGVFTSYNDDTVGEILPSSTGSQAQAYAGAIYFIAGDRSLENVRFNHIYVPIYLESSGTSSLTVRNVQVTDAAYFIDAGTAPISIYNGLFYNCGSIFSGGWASFVGEHLTVHNASVLGAGSTNATVKNSLIVNVTEHPPNDMGTYSETATEDLASGSGVFQTVGAGAHYLVDPSPHRDAGTTNIESTLRAELRKRTTYPPEVIAPVGAYYGVSQTWFPRAGRDTDLPDLGYHYAPLDYAISFIYLTNATIRIDPGTAIGVFNTNSYATYGLALSDGAKLLAQGQAERLVSITEYSTVQEMANTNWAKPIHSLIHTWDSPAGTPELRGRFSQFTSLGNITPLVDAGGDGVPWHFTDAQFHGGVVNDWITASAFTNCLFNRVFAWFSPVFGNRTNQFYNCTFYGGAFLGWSADTNQIRIHDTLFANTPITNDPAVSSHIGYYGTNRLSPVNASDQVLTNFAFQTGTLGRFYVPSNALFNAGSRYATNAGLYHYTMFTNQVKEATNTVDIGFHYVATDANGTPLDYDEDGVPDYWEDQNGNGTTNTGEINWQDADTDADGVNDGLELLQGRNPLGGTTNDVNNLLNLRVFTPLK